VSEALEAIRRALADFSDTIEGYETALREDFGLLILRAIEDQGISQKVLADKADVPEPFVSRLVNAKSNCELRTIALIMHALGVKPALVRRTTTTDRMEDHGKESQAVKRSIKLSDTYPIANYSANGLTGTGPGNPHGVVRQRKRVGKGGPPTDRFVLVPGGSGVAKSEIRDFPGRYIGAARTTNHRSIG
jgi:predicted XRE-type DNA-binding protein